MSEIFYDDESFLASLTRGLAQVDQAVVRDDLLDDEEFCPTCLAGTESGEHLVKCGED